MSQKPPTEFHTFSLGALTVFGGTVFPLLLDSFGPSAVCSAVSEVFWFLIVQKGGFKMFQEQVN